MRLRPLGHSGTSVSELGLGTMTFGAEVDEKESDRILGRYFEHGGSLIDTADVYSQGGAEELLGRCLGSRRRSVVLATKGGLPFLAQPGGHGSSRAYLTKALHASLRRLQTDWIDLYQVHWPDFSVAADELVETLDAFITAGLIRHAGVSNYLGSDVIDMLDSAARAGRPRIVSNQVQYSLACRDIELEVLPVCERTEVGVLAWSPLAGGVLTAKHPSASDPLPGTRMQESQAEATRLTERNLAIAAEVASVAEEVDRTPAQVALNWLSGRRGVTAPIIGVRSAEQLEELMGSVGWSLDGDHAARLERASRTPLPYPHNMYRLLGLREYR